MEINLDGLPSNIKFDILSRLPVKCLARDQCVSKRWCEDIGDPYLGIIHEERGVVEEPIPIMFHESPLDEVPRSLCFHIIESFSKHGGNTTDHVLKDMDLEFVCETTPDEDFIRIRFLGSCNGLLFIGQGVRQLMTTLSVIHPLRKECYELPPFPLPLSYFFERESCGLGFDASTDTLKMVCVLLRRSVSPKKLDVVRENLCTMVHVFGANSWHELPQVPSYPIQGAAVYAHGGLHWLVSYLDRQTDEVIWFDVRKEEFGLINPPKRTGVRTNLDQLDSKATTS